MGTPLKEGKFLFVVLLLCGVAVKGAEMEPLEEDFLLFLGEWVDERGDVLVPEESELWPESPQNEVRRQRHYDEGGSTREDQWDE
ncbi:hypothetical protein ACJJIG_01725 [Microbulbifer sp. SSSA007]|uniref:hypothetical protein n=1 Tax=Microbulbifer TaxID=48073 RepID=UPI000375EEAC|nr:hypothetical protein [Microbulbifer variabilis]